MKENKANDISSLFFFINLRHKNWEKIIRDKQCQKKTWGMSCTEYKLAADDLHRFRNLSLTLHLIKSQTTSAPPQETAIIVLLINYWLITNKPWNQWHTLPIVHATAWVQTIYHHVHVEHSFLTQSYCNYCPNTGT